MGQWTAITGFDAGSTLRSDVRTRVVISKRASGSILGFRFLGKDKGMRHVHKDDIDVNDAVFSIGSTDQLAGKSVHLHRNCVLASTASADTYERQEDAIPPGGTLPWRFQPAAEFENPAGALSRTASAGTPNPPERKGMNPLAVSTAIELVLWAIDCSSRQVASS